MFLTLRASRSNATEVVDQGNSNEVPASHEDIEVISIREENRTDSQIILTSEPQIEDRFSKLENSLARIVDSISEIPTKLEERLVSNLEDKLTRIMEGKLENLERHLGLRLSKLEVSNIAVVQQVDDIIKRVNRDNRDKIKRTNTFRSIGRKSEDSQV